LLDQIHMRHGQRHGLSEHYVHGRLIQRAEYSQGQPHGLARTRILVPSLNEVAKLQYHQKHGVNHGLYQSWYSNEQLKRQCTFFKDELHGVMETWTRDGVLISRAVYVHGKKQTVWRRFKTWIKRHL
jgi:antitoxin component YwqK of YwqJK toxin-antitoxin module